jgi:hypothetical protein
VPSNKYLPKFEKCIYKVIELKDKNCMFQVIFLVSAEAGTKAAFPNNLANVSFPSYDKGSDRNHPHFKAM